MKTCTFLSVFALFVGCQNELPNQSHFSKEMSVFSLLSTHTQRQEVYVYYTTDRVGDYVDKNELFVGSARVTIISELQEVTFRYAIDDGTPMFIDLPDTLQILPGKTYRLKGISDAGTITGQTRVPQKFHIQYPATGDTVESNMPLFLSWTHSQESYGYVINLKQPFVEIPITPDSTLVERPVRTFSATNTNYTIPDYLLEESGKYLLQIMAYDENFYNHFKEGDSRSGIEGGYGVFGSAVVDTVHFFVKE